VLGLEISSNLFGCLALGAESSAIVRLVLARCSGPAICGLGFGALCAFLLEKAAAMEETFAWF
jgi:hypothetical protein